MPRRGRHDGHPPEQRPPGRLPLEHGDVPSRVRRGRPDARELLLVRSGLRRYQPWSHIPRRLLGAGSMGLLRPHGRRLPLQAVRLAIPGARGAGGPRDRLGQRQPGAGARGRGGLCPGAAGARKRREDLRPHGRRRPDQGAERRGQANRLQGEAFEHDRPGRLEPHPDLGHP